MLQPDFRGLPAPSPEWALFLDVDGTLVEIANTPDEVRVSADILHLLERLRDGLDGAVALVSGRPIVELDRLFAPLHLPAAGQHGLEQRGVSGPIRRAVVTGDALDRARAAINDLASHHPGIVLEDKGLSLAVHYRRAPEAEPRIRTILDGISVAADSPFHVQTGKMVLELKPAGTSKGTVVERFLDAPPFATRTPVFLGDDVTDEDGFAAVQARGGYGIRIGAPSVTVASHELSSVRAAVAWLERLAEVLNPPRHHAPA